MAPVDGTKFAASQNTQSPGSIFFDSKKMI